MFNEAIEVLNKSFMIASKEYINWRYLGIALFNTNRIDEAINSFYRALELNKYDEESLYYLGLCCKEINDYNKAIEIFEKCLEYSDNNKKIYVILYELYKNTGNDKSKNMLEKINKL